MTDSIDPEPAPDSGTRLGSLPLEPGATVWVWQRATPPTSIRGRLVAEGRDAIRGDWVRVLLPTGAEIEITSRIETDTVIEPLDESDV